MEPELWYPACNPACKQVSNDISTTAINLQASNSLLYRAKICSLVPLACWIHKTCMRSSRLLSITSRWRRHASIWKLHQATVCNNNKMSRPMTALTDIDITWAYTNIRHIEHDYCIRACHKRYLYVSCVVLLRAINQSINQKTWKYTRHEYKTDIYARSSNNKNKRHVAVVQTNSIYTRRGIILELLFITFLAPSSVL